MTSGGPRPGGDSLVDTALLFLRLGTTAFGGPAAHIAMMEDEVVVRRRLGHARGVPRPGGRDELDSRFYLTQLAIHLGYRRAGWRGLLVAGLCFIVPAVLLVTAIRVGLCAVWIAARDVGGAAPRDQARRDRDHRAGAVAAWTFGREVAAVLGFVGAAAFVAVALGAHARWYLVLRVSPPR